MGFFKASNTELKCFVWKLMAMEFQSVVRMLLQSKELEKKMHGFTVAQRRWPTGSLSILGLPFR